MPRLTRTATANCRSRSWRVRTALAWSLCALLDIFCVCCSLYGPAQPSSRTPSLARAASRTVRDPAPTPCGFILAPTPCGLSRRMPVVVIYDNLLSCRARFEARVAVVPDISESVLVCARVFKRLALSSCRGLPAGVRHQRDNIQARRPESVSSHSHFRCCPLGDQCDVCVFMCLYV